MEKYPTAPKKIRERIRRYEHALAQEQTATGFISDGYGKRYMLAPLYLLADDVPGCLQSLDWFQTTFPDDIGDPEQSLCWTLALYRNGDLAAARQRLSMTMLMNLYLIPALWGEQLKAYDIWHGSNLAEPEYLDWISAEIFALWNDDATAWAEQHYHSPPFTELRTRHIEIERQLLHEKPGPKRTRLCNESSRLERQGIRAVEPT